MKKYIVALGLLAFSVPFISYATNPPCTITVIPSIVGLAATTPVTVTWNSNVMYGVISLSGHNSRWSLNESGMVPNGTMTLPISGDTVTTFTLTVPNGTCSATSIGVASHR